MLIIVFSTWLYCVIKRSKFFLHMLQLEGYKGRNYIKWLNKSENAYSHKLKKSLFLLSVAALVYAVLANMLKDNLLLGLRIIYYFIWTILIAINSTFKMEETKKPLVFTSRAKRLFVTNVLMNLVLAFIVFSLYRLYLGLSLTYVPLALYFYFIIYVLQSYMVFISNLINKPIEMSIYRYYYQRAQKKINKMDKLSVVGITGSFGKTSTKFITTTILKQEYKVLTTPESYNTPMGISKVINENLTDEFDVFVAEMGARNIGDIRELAKLTKPTIGVITSIGPTHLETFKNIDNIMKTKYELIEELPPEGIAIFNYDNKYVKKLADKTFKEKLLFGMEDVEKLDLYAENIEVTEEGTMFTITDKKGNSVQCKTKLLGKHNIYNILAGACVAMALGLNLDQIRKGIEKIEPIPHRLNIINPGTGITIIDDSFNSNPIGAKAALEVLQQFKGGKKIIVTPGMVELGERQEEANRELGLNIAKVCDYVILVGKHITKSIYEGLIEAGYNEEHIFVVNTLKDATAIIQRIAKPKDIILFENDLPDNYYA